jgi:hypothetical protein
MALLLLLLQPQADQAVLRQIRDVLLGSGQLGVGLIPHGVGDASLDLGDTRIIPVIFRVDLEPQRLPVGEYLLAAEVSHLPLPQLYELHHQTGMTGLAAGASFEVLAGDHVGRQDINPYGVMWFYYAYDWSRDGDLCQIFFAVCGEEIVLESCNFSCDAPLILRMNKEDDPIWHSQPYFDEAVVKYWYNKFYTETINGQIMVLRPDEPILHYYERPSGRDAVKDVALVTLIKMYRLSWVVVTLLIGIAFPEIKVIMGIVASLLFIDVLWRCWATRKVGQ